MVVLKRYDIQKLFQLNDILLAVCSRIYRVTTKLKFPWIFVGSSEIFEIAEPFNVTFQEK